MIPALLVNAGRPRFAFSQHITMAFDKGPDEGGLRFYPSDESCQLAKKTAARMQEHAVKPDVQNAASCSGRDHTGGIVCNPEGNFFARGFLQMVFKGFF